MKIEPIVHPDIAPLLDQTGVDDLNLTISDEFGRESNEANLTIFDGGLLRMMQLPLLALIRHCRIHMTYLFQFARMNFQGVPNEGPFTDERCSTKETLGSMYVRDEFNATPNLPKCGDILPVMDHLDATSYSECGDIIAPVINSVSSLQSRCGSLSRDFSLTDECQTLSIDLLLSDLTLLLSELLCAQLRFSIT